jgi:hypothetical protein
MFRSKRFNDDSKSLNVCLPALAPSVRQQVDEAIQTAAEFMGMSVASEAELIRALGRIRRGEQQGPVIWEPHTGLLEFLRSAFPKVQESTLYGQVFIREPQGRGAHFDVYDDLLDVNYPWVALFNLAGEAVVTVCRLPPQLAERYARTHPDPSDEAYEERRRIADEALASSSVHREKGMLYAECGLIIPQQRSGPEWVHHVAPTHAENPGRFVKFAVVRDANAGYLRDRGYTPLDGLLRRALLNAPTEGSGDSEIRPRRRCNLD